jgi:hypothetical protein
MIKWDDEGKIVEFKVLIRPLKAVMRLTRWRAQRGRTPRPGGRSWNPASRTVDAGPNNPMIRCVPSFTTVAAIH